MLNAHTLIIRLPSRHMAKHMQDWRLQPLPFALTDEAEHILHSGIASVASLNEQQKKIKKIILLLAASDVTLFSLVVPPLSPEKLKIALPALIEDSIIGDPALCHIVVGADSKGLRKIAVIDRAWLITVVNALQKDGVRKIHAYPSQLCLPLLEHSVAAAILEIGDEAELILRRPNHEAIGIALHTDKNSLRREESICRSLSLLALHENCQLMVESSKVQAYSAAASRLASSLDNPNEDKVSKLHIIPDDWKIFIAESKKIESDLMMGLSNTSYKTSDLKIWKWPLALAASLLAFHMLALYVDSWRMRQEKKQILAHLDNVYKKHFLLSAKPEIQLEKLEEKLLMLRQKNGENAPEDFLSMLANTSLAWKRIVLEDKNTRLRQPHASSDYVVAHAITKLNYRNQALQISLQSELAPETVLAKARLTENHLTLVRSENSTVTRPSLVIWHVQAGR